MTRALTRVEQGREASHARGSAHTVSRTYQGRNSFSKIHWAGIKSNSFPGRNSFSKIQKGYLMPTLRVPTLLEQVMGTDVFAAAQARHANEFRDRQGWTEEIWVGEDEESETRAAECSRMGFMGAIMELREDLW